MQVMPAEPAHYLSLVLLIPFCLTSISPTHIAFLGVQLLLRPSTTGNYCNAIVSILLSFFLLLDNLANFCLILETHSSHIFWQMQLSIFRNFTFYVLMSEAVYLLLWAHHSYHNYKEYRADMISLA